MILFKKGTDNMGKKDKLIERLISHPKDFSFDEVESLLCYFGYTIDNRGRTSGSRICFINKSSNSKIILHKPHSRKEILNYQIKQLIEQLKKEDLI